MAKDAADESMFVRERLIRGAMALIEQEGCSSLGVRRLAQASDRTTMCVYSKFGSRGNLLAAVYRRIGEALLTELRTSDDAPESYRTWAREHAHLYILLFDQPLDALDVSERVRLELVTELIEHFGAASGAEEWSRLHGEVTLERITSFVPEREPLGA